ncbi:MAG: hypothetical protein P9L90_02865 [Candidatus Aadella gelida]|nr:hypothetical protein [Candidatus Aadella gelida]
MKKTIKKKITVILVIAVYCSTAFSEQSASADAKFLSRIARKQASLVEMGQNYDDMRKAFGNHMKEQDMSEEVSRVMENAALMSDSKYTERLEQKLTAIIKDSINSADSLSMLMPNPALMGTVTPESEDKLERTEEKQI